jgi:hypothetical protein
MLKAFNRISAKIRHRRTKRDQRHTNDHITASPRRLATGGGAY